MPALVRSLAHVHKSLMLYSGVEGHGTSVHPIGKASSEIGMLYSSSRQHAGAAAALLGLGCIIVYNVHHVCMQLLGCNGRLVHLQV
jgi:hypothetical protein